MCTDMPFSKGWLDFNNEINNENENEKNSPARLQRSFFDVSQVLSRKIFFQMKGFLSVKERDKFTNQGCSLLEFRKQQ